jgi:uncharacterized spore protein YtfJ
MNTNKLCQLTSWTSKCEKLKGNNMKSSIKQILIGTMVVAFTACGGGGGTDTSRTTGEITSGYTTTGDGSDTGIRLKKITEVFIETNMSRMTVYEYGSNNMITKETITSGLPNTDMTKFITSTTYTKENKVKQYYSEYFDEFGSKKSITTQDMFYENNRLLKSETKYEYLDNPSSNNDRVTTYSKYQGYFSTQSTTKSHNAAGELTGTTYGSTTVKNNKVNSIRITSKETPKSETLISYEYDTLNRVNIYNQTVKDEYGALIQKYNYKYTFDDNKNVAEPLYICFAGYKDQLKKNMPTDSVNSCALITKTIADVGVRDNNTHVIVLNKNTLDDRGLLIERKITRNGKSQYKYSYEYEAY